MYNETPGLVIQLLVFKNEAMEKIMKIGCFSISLAVKDLKTSKAFYEKIGFEVFAGEESQGFLIMKHGDTNIGLFPSSFSVIDPDGNPILIDQHV